MNIEKMNQAFENIVYRHDGRNLAGFAVIALRNGEIVYENALGKRDFTRDLPFTLDTRVRIASVSKTFVTIGAMRLRDMGLLDLDADVSGYLGFSLRNPRYPDTAITTRMLMSHTSSLRDNDDYWLPVGADIRDFFRDDRYWAEEAPGYYCYCNLNFGMLGAVIECLSGEKFNHYMNRHVLAPMGIKASFDVSDFDEAEIQNLSPIFNGDGKGGWNPRIDDCRGAIVPRDEAKEAVLPGVNSTLYSPQGGLRISPRELTALVRFFQSGGSGIITPESVRQMLTPVWTYDGTNGTTDDGFDQCYALGVRFLTGHEGDALVKDRFIPYYGHTGSAYGLFSGYCINRENGDAIIYACNGTECHTETPLSHGLYSQNWIWVEELMTALHAHIFTP